LSQRCYLLVRASAIHYHAEWFQFHPPPFTWVHPYGNDRLIELEFGAVEPEFLCCGHKLLEMWNGDGGFRLLDELDLERLEVRCHDVRKEPLQVSTDTLEHKPAKVRKRNVRHTWHVQELSLDIVGGNRGEKANPEGLQLGNERKP